MSNDLREVSRRGFKQKGDLPLHEDIQTGCLQRIADATEKMAANHDALLRDLKFYKERFQVNLQEIERLSRSNAALRGVITKLKTNTRP